MIYVEFYEDLVGDLGDKAEKDGAAIYEDQLKGTQKDPPYIVAVDGNKIVGGLWIHKYFFKELDPNDDIIEIETALLPEYQRKGLGKKLHEQALYEIKKEYGNIKIIALPITEAGKGIIKFFGFRESENGWWVKGTRNPRLVLVAALHRVVSSSQAFLSKFDSLMKNPKLYEEWESFIEHSDLSKNVDDEGNAWHDNPTDQDIFEHIVQHGLKGWEHLSDYESIEDWQEDDDDWSDQWKRFVTDYIQYRYDNVSKEFKRFAKFKNGKLEVYRCIEISKEKRNEFRDSVRNGSADLGIYWSFDYGTARCYWGDSYEHSREEVTITGLIDVSAMNAENTFYKLLHPITGGELEIELNKGASVEVTGIQGIGVGLKKDESHHVTAYEMRR